MLLCNNRNNIKGAAGTPELKGSLIYFSVNIDFFCKTRWQVSRAVCMSLSRNRPRSIYQVDVTCVKISKQQ